jgi:hypothetical protein
LRHELEEAAVAFVADGREPSVPSQPWECLPMKRDRLRSFIELLQNGDTTDDERIMMEDELFKRGYPNELQYK